MVFTQIGRPLRTWNFPLFRALRCSSQSNSVWCNMMHVFHFPTRSHPCAGTSFAPRPLPSPGRRTAARIRRLLWREIGPAF